MRVPLAKVGADVDATVVVAGGFSLPKVACFLEAVDAAFWATCSFCARSFAAGLVFLTQDLDLGGISIEESGHEPKWRKTGRHTDEHSRRWSVDKVEQRETGPNGSKGEMGKDQRHVNTWLYMSSISPAAASTRLPHKKILLSRLRALSSAKWVELSLHLSMREWGQQIGGKKIGLSSVNS